MRKHLIKNSILRKFLPSIIIIVFIVSLFLTSIIRSRIVCRRIATEFPKLSYMDSINNLVTEKYELKEIIPQYTAIRYSPYVTNVMFDNKYKFAISIHNSKTDIEIDKVLEVGDRIIKNKESDTIFIYKNNTLYYEYFAVIDTVLYVKPFKK